MQTDVMKNHLYHSGHHTNASANNLNDDYHTSQSNLTAHRAATASLLGSSRHQLGGAQHDEMSQDLNYLSHEAPLDGGESTFGARNSYSHLAGSGNHLAEPSGGLGDASASNISTIDENSLSKLRPDNVDIQRPPLKQAG